MTVPAPHPQAKIRGSYPTLGLTGLDSENKTTTLKPSNRRGYARDIRAMQMAEDYETVDFDEWRQFDDRAADDRAVGPARKAETKGRCTNCWVAVPALLIKTFGCIPPER